LKHNRISKLKDAYNTLTSGVSYKEVQNLLKREVPEVYSFYVKRMENPEIKGKSLMGKIHFGRRLFKRFLMELSPARRILYLISLIIFFESIMNNSIGWGLAGFLLLNLLIALELADKISSNEELSVARDIQNSLLPSNPPKNANYDISSYSETAKSVGGDYFDFVQNGNDLVIAIGDISGKGMAAAIHMVQVQALFRHILSGHTSPKAILGLLNGDLIKLFLPGTFFTINLAFIKEDGTIIYCRAGHLPIIHYYRKEDRCINLVPKGIGIGLSRNGIFENTMEERIILPEQGDILVFFTDGITEAMNNYLMEYGEERLQAVITKNAFKSAQGIKSSIIDSIKNFTNSAPVYDDITLIVLKKY
jgi:phosphoserine phosphatase RsbU/P